jgi:hypothetical protein
MAMKLDKETLIKHRFWFLLGAFVPLWLIALVILLGVASDITKKRQEYDKQVGVAKGIDKADTKTEHFIKPLKDQEEALRGHKLTVWWDVWNSQIDPETGKHFMDDWPYNNITPTFQRLAVNGKFFEKISDGGELNTYKQHLYENYVLAKKQKFEQILAKHPSSPGYTPIAINWDKVMPVRKLTQTPTSEECWLAQEDLWVKQQIFKAIRAALDASAQFQPVKLKDTDPLPENAVKRYVFRNPNWELDLRLDQDEKGKLFLSPSSRIKNINAHKRRLELREVYILLRQKQPNGDYTRWVWLLIQGKPLVWNTEAPVVAEKLGVDDFGFTRDAPMEAEQLFTPNTSPIKRIDDLELGYNSHRTSKVAEALRPFVKDESSSAGGGAQGGFGGAQGGAGGAQGGAAGAQGGAAGAQGGAAGAQGGSGSSAPPGNMGNIGGRGGDAVASNKTPNGFIRNRYLQVTPQVRRLPFGIVLVVDQDYMQDVQTAFINSRLRIQPTQDHWYRDAAGIQSASSGAFGGSERGSERGGGGDAGRGSGSRGGSDRGSGREGGPPPGVLGSGARFGSFPPEAFGRGGAPGPGPSLPTTPEPDSGVDDSDPNLVEMAFYGVISLYDRPTAEAPKAQPKEGDKGKDGDKPKDGPKDTDKPKDGGAAKDSDKPKDGAAKDSSKPKDRGAAKDSDKPKDGAAKDSSKPKDGGAPKNDDKSKDGDKTKKDAAPRAEDKKPEAAKDK